MRGGVCPGLISTFVPVEEVVIPEDVTELDEVVACVVAEEVVDVVVDELTEVLEEDSGSITYNTIESSLQFPSA